MTVGTVVIAVQLTVSADAAVGAASATSASRVSAMKYRAVRVGTVIGVSL
jgi:hypothetical protein